MTKRKMIKTQITNIKNKRRYHKDPTDIKIIVKYYRHFYTGGVNKLDKMDKFFQKHNKQTHLI